LLAACGAVQAQSAANDTPDKLKPGNDESQILIASAKGVQIYECRAKNDGSGYEWAFVAPDAILFDHAGHVIGKHYAGPHWESVDGSKIVGTVKERMDAPAAGNIPWLLLSTHSDGPAGAFSMISSVQRLHTAGGTTPKEGCSRQTAGTQARVGYTADYYFFATPAAIVPAPYY
jgi:hypothetical protein